MAGRIESVWRYPVKSMRGEALDKVFVGYNGLIGDRVYAIGSDQRGTRFPWYTARAFETLICHTARFRDAVATLGPVNPEAAHPNLSGDAAFDVEVETPEGIRVPLDDAEFLAGLPTKDDETLTLHYSPRNFVDVTPISLLSSQTVAQLSDEVKEPLSAERFRANFNVDWDTPGGFQEDALVGKRLRIGEAVEIAITERDARCKMITLDPETGEAMPQLLKHVLATHDGCVGVYGTVLREGFVSPNDNVEIIA